jgi:hypothetical protein
VPATSLFSIAGLTDGQAESKNRSLKNNIEKVFAPVLLVNVRDDMYSLTEEAKDKSYDLPPQRVKSNEIINSLENK